MKRMYVTAAVVILIPWTSSAGPQEPTLRFESNQFVVTSASAPPSECKATLVPAPAPAAGPAAKGGAKGMGPKPTGAAKPGAAAKPAGGPGAAGAAAAPAEQSYVVTLGSDCIGKLALGIEKRDITLDKDGLYEEKTKDGKTNEVKVAHVFASSGKELDNPPKVDEQGPLVLVLNDGTIVTTDSLKPTSEPDDLSKLGPCDWSRARDADVKLDMQSQSVIEAPPRSVVEPNAGLTVYVCHDPTKSVTVLWGGSRGLTRADVGTPQQQAEGIDKGKQPKVTEIKPTYTRFAFPPRTAGNADLKVFEGTDTSGTPKMAVELEVEPLYWGAVRFGLGTLFGDWNSYQVATFSGSHQPEIRQDPQHAAFELVSGFAPYVIDDIAWGGRSQSGGHDAYLAPFIGFGVIGQTPTQGVEGLTSFHLGVELELADNFSIAATFVYRRSKELAGGYSAGSPVASGMTVDNVTVDSWEPGFAIVVNATPAFLQFATGSPAPKNGGGS